MQKVILPLVIDAERAAQKRLDYAGLYAHNKMARLAGSVVSVDSDVGANLSFHIDNQALTVITGSAHVVVTLLCQRCEQMFSHAMQISYCFSPVRNEAEVDVLPDTYEPVDVDEFGQVDLLAMIEDELILSLPIVPMHQAASCEISDADRVFGELPEETEKVNPFAILASLKKSN